MNYTEYSNQSASEKIGLCIIEASKRLMGWTVHSGSVYKLENQDFIKVTSVVDSGTSYTEAASLGVISAGKWYYDRVNGVLYLQASDSSNPNSRYLVITFRLYFSNVPVIAPHDLSTGFDIEWTPLFKESSEFGVEIDTSPDQIGIAIEGSGSLTLVNDKDYWSSKFGRYTFENKNVYVYSWSRDIPITEAQIVFRGKIQEKQYLSDTITFLVKDIFNQLRQPLDLDSVGSISGVRVPLSFYPTKKRQVYGFVDGFRPQNIDQSLEDGYPITGTIASATGSVVTGSGTAFLNELRPSDHILIEKPNGVTVEAIIQFITSDTSLTLTQDLIGSQLDGIASSTLSVNPNLPKSYINRLWQLTNHALCEPMATVTAVSGPNLFQVDTIQDFTAGDLVNVGGVLTTIRNLVGTDRIRLNSFSGVVTIGSTIKRVTVTSVKINKDTLTYLSDYTYDPTLGQLTLTGDAEFNIASTETLSGSVTFTNGSRVVTGVDTSFSANLDVNSRVKDPLSSTWYYVLSVINDFNIELTANYTGTTGTHIDLVNYKTPKNYTEGSDVLTCSLIGATEDGTVTGKLITTAPKLVEDLLSKAGLSSEINTSSFDDAANEIDHRVGLVIPDSYSDRTTPSIRDIINNVNRSVFGILTQNDDFDFEYSVISPDKTTAVKKFLEDDYISIAFSTNSNDAIKSVSVNYSRQEYNPLTKDVGISQITANSDRGTYLIGTKKETDFNSIVYDESSARIIANRWKLFLEIGRTIIEIQSKLQASRIKITDPIEVGHRFGYQGENGSVFKLGALTTSKRTIFGTSILVDDFADSFSRCATIASNSLVDYDSSSESEILYNGFITDQYGLINNDADTNDRNLIW